MEKYLIRNKKGNAKRCLLNKKLTVSNYLRFTALAFGKSVIEPS